jgi:5S rRNA maturation endonuclease (ribonuclease M5)
LRATVEVRLERLQKLIARIEDESRKGSAIVVEGQRDRDSLRRMGVTGSIMCVQSSRRNPFGFAEELGDMKEVIILTDFDRQGVYLAKRLSRILNSQKVRANLVLWRELRRLAKSDIRSIEELPKYYQRLQDEERGYPYLESGYELPLLTKGRKHDSANRRKG